ncbi:MAG: hypothetical protein KF716_30735 [Anaerolineae bacterium]|nr:hypothetical protein [Anaerolineae bacterium]
MVVIGHQLPRRRRRRAWFIFLFGLLAAVVLLLVGNGVIALLRALDRPAKPSSGALLYATDFSAENASNVDWLQEPGQSSTQIADGVMRISIDEVRSIYSVLKRDFRDIDARVNASITAATGDFTEYGIVFRYHDDNNYYMFLLRGDGAYSVQMIKNGEPDVISTWQRAPSIKSGLNQINQLRVVASDDSFQFFVNDEPLPLCLKGSDRRSTWSGPDTGKCISNNQQTSISFKDNSFADGKIGVGARADSPGMRVAFDNVLIFGPN